MKQKYRLVLATAGLACTLLRAQSTLGTISGVVTDASGAVVPGARVELIDEEEGTRRTTICSSEGRYEFLNVKSNTYRLTAEKEGFAIAKAPGIHVGSRQSVRVGLRLDIAMGLESVEVVGLTRIVTEDATLSEGKSFDEITRLPLNFRGAGLNPLPVLMTFPGVQGDQGNAYSIGGARPVLAEYSIDGITTISPRYSTPSPQVYPSAEMISEFNVSQANLGAEHGRMGDVTIVTKGGTNDWHGSAFWYHQNAAVDATAWGESEKPPRVYHTAGGSIAGPVEVPGLYDGRNRTFWFADVEVHRHPEPQFGVASVPTGAMRAGDLRDVPGPPAIDPLSGQPFPGNQIPASRMNAVANRLLERYYPLPNRPEAGISENYHRAIANRSDADRYDIRLDQYVSQRQQIFARWSAGSFPSITGYDPILPASSYDFHTKAVAVSHTYAPRPNLSNEFRFGVTSSDSREHFPIPGKDAVGYLGLQGLNLSHAGDTGGLPDFDFSWTTGFDAIGHGRDDRPRSRTIQFTDALSWVRGRHTFKFGGDVRRPSWHDTAHNGYNDEFGVFAFDGSIAGNSFAELLLGLPAWTSFAVLGPDLNESSLSMQFFAEDHWSVTRRLRIEAGLRWEAHGPMREAAGNQTNFDHRTGAVIIPDHALPPSPGFLESINACPGEDAALPCTPVVTASRAGLPEALRKTDLHDFAPRLGFAWQPREVASVVLRGGVGIYYEPLLGRFASTSTAIHTSDNRTYYNSVQPGRLPLFSLPDVSAGPFAASQTGVQDFMYGVDPNLRTPRSYQWNLTIEGRLPGSMSGRISYIGLNSVGMPVAADFNQVHASPQPYSPTERPFRDWQRMFSYESLGFANYQGLQLETSRRVRGGAFFQASYVFSKNLGDTNSAAQGSQFFAGEVFQKVLVDRYDVRLDRGNLGGSRRGRFLVTGVFPLPVGKGRRFGSEWRGIGGALLGGWEMSTVTLVESGEYLTPWMNGGLDQSNTNVTGRSGFARPDRIGSGSLAHPTPDQFWDRNAFVAPPPEVGRFGNAGAGILEGPGMIAVAAGLAKTAALAEGIRMRFEASFTNVPNHPNFQPPSVRWPEPSFGQIMLPQTGENGGNRRGQLGLRFDF